MVFSSGVLRYHISGWGGGEEVSLELLLIWIQAALNLSCWQPLPGAATYPSILALGLERNHSARV